MRLWPQRFEAARPSVAGLCPDARQSWMRLWALAAPQQTPSGGSEAGHKGSTIHIHGWAAGALGAWGPGSAALAGALQPRALCFGCGIVTASWQTVPRGHGYIQRQGPADATALPWAEGQDRPLPSLRQRERGGPGGWGGVGGAREPRAPGRTPVRISRRPGLSDILKSPHWGRSCEGPEGVTQRYPLPR